MLPKQKTDGAVPVPLRVAKPRVADRRDAADRHDMNPQQRGNKGQLQNISTEGLLAELAQRGGHPGAVAQAVLLCLRKSQDYNQGMGCEDPHTVDRSGYFPFGAASYAQMLHTKSQRFNSLVRKELNGGRANFEGLRDTALDIINYAGFFVAWHDEEGAK